MVALTAGDKSVVGLPQATFTPLLGRRHELIVSHLRGVLAVIVRIRHGVQNLSRRIRISLNQTCSRFTLDESPVK